MIPADEELHSRAGMAIGAICVDPHPPTLATDIAAIMAGLPLIELPAGRRLTIADVRAALGEQSLRLGIVMGGMGSVIQLLSALLAPTPHPGYARAAVQGLLAATAADTPAPDPNAR